MGTGEELPRLGDDRRDQRALPDFFRYSVKRRSTCGEGSQENNEQKIFGHSLLFIDATEHRNLCAGKCAFGSHAYVVVDRRTFISDRRCLGVFFWQEEPLASLSIDGWR